MASSAHGTVQVVCPSYGRTGTLSMKAALEILGFGPCYHMTNVMSIHGKDHHPQLWLDGYEGSDLAVSKILNGYKAVVDWPAADFYQDILAANPDAKVVVTVRDADAWWKSMLSSISFKNPTRMRWGYFFCEVFIADVHIFRKMQRHIKALTMDEEEAKAEYNLHNEEVLAHVGADKLLEFSVKEGWEPLCEFLGVPVPDVPFPRVNSTEEITGRFRRDSRMGWVMMATAVAVGGASVVAAAFFGGKRIGGALAATEVAVLGYRLRKTLATKRRR